MQEENVSEEVEPEVEFQEEEKENPYDRLYARQKFYHFIRQRNKPSKGEMKNYKLPKRETEEPLQEYFDRCYKEVGVRPAPIGPIKMPKPNSKCLCGSGKKFKKCCERK